MNIELWNQYKNSVIDLASKLPQWNSFDLHRKYYSAISSLFEEAGELAGICSKMRSRSKEYGVSTKEQTNFNDARQKFIDETSDFLWVLTCTSWCLNTDVDVFCVINESINNFVQDFDDTTDCDFELFLYDLFSSIVEFTLDNKFKSIVYEFGYFLEALNREYNITFEDLIQHNMDKLNNRYDKDGKRVDGK